MIISKSETTSFLHFTHMLSRRWRFIQLQNSRIQLISGIAGISYFKNRVYISNIMNTLYFKENIIQCVKNISPSSTCCREYIRQISGILLKILSFHFNKLNVVPLLFNSIILFSSIEYFLWWFIYLPHFCTHNFICNTKKRF